MSQQPPAPYNPPPAQPPASAPPPQQWTPPVVAGPAPGVKYAGNGARFIAWIVDGLILSVLIWVVVIVVGILIAAIAATGSDTAAALGIVAAIAAVFVVSLAYLPWFWSHGGQTPGMKILRLRLVRAVDGGPVGGGQAVLRLIGYYISAFVFYIGFLWILIDSRRQGWHDKIAGTVMIEVA